MLAMTMSKIIGLTICSGVSTVSWSPIPLFWPFSRVVLKALGSMSVAVARKAPYFRAATASIPDPQPQSSSVRWVRSILVNCLRQSAVVGCVPVPKARPGSIMILTALGTGGRHQLGQIHRLPSTLNGLNWSRPICSQLRSAKIWQLIPVCPPLASWR